MYSFWLFNGLVALMILNHWLIGSHELSLLRHLQALATILLDASTSRQREVLSLVVEAKCILEVDVVFHMEPGLEQLVRVIVTLFFGPLLCKHKCWFLIRSCFLVWLHGSELLHGPRVSIVLSLRDRIRQSPVNGWKTRLKASVLGPGPSNQINLKKIKIQPNIVMTEATIFLLTMNHHILFKLVNIATYVLKTGLTHNRSNLTFWKYHNYIGKNCLCKKNHC